MDVPVEIINGGIMGAVVLLLGNSGTLIRLHQKLSDHIKDEEGNQSTLRDVRQRLRRVERKLPNGEIALMYDMVKDMYVDDHGSLGKFKARVRAVEEQVRLEEIRDEKDTIEEIFDGVEAE